VPTATSCPATQRHVVPLVVFRRRPSPPCEVASASLPGQKTCIPAEVKCPGPPGWKERIRAWPFPSRSFPLANGYSDILTRLQLLQSTPRFEGVRSLLSWHYREHLQSHVAAAARSQPFAGLHLLPCGQSANRRHDGHCDSSPPWSAPGVALVIMCRTNGARRRRPAAGRAFSVAATGPPDGNSVASPLHRTAFSAAPQPAGLTMEVSSGWNTLAAGASNE
jgi:hypothetical protein